MLCLLVDMNLPPWVLPTPQYRRFRFTRKETRVTPINHVHPHMCRSDGILTSRHAGGCRVDLTLVTEPVREAMLFAYPYNALRNTALLRADTEVTSIPANLIRSCRPSHPCPLSCSHPETHLVCSRSLACKFNVPRHLIVHMWAN